MERLYVCQIHSVERVSKVKSILCIIFLALHGAVCFQLTQYSYDDTENICTLSYFHHQIGSMSYELFAIV